LENSQFRIPPEIFSCFTGSSHLKPPESRPQLLWHRPSITHRRLDLPLTASLLRPPEIGPTGLSASPVLFLIRSLFLKLSLSRSLSLIRSLSRVLSLTEKRGRKDQEDEERGKKRRGGREEGAVNWWVLRERTEMTREERRKKKK
jgi:hypothetical protein